MSIWRLGLYLVFAGLLAACATGARVSDRESPKNDRAAAVTAAMIWGQSDWQHFRLPGKQATSYQPLRYGEREAVAVRASSSASLLRRPVDVQGDALGALRFSWKVPALVPQADLGRREVEDSVVRVVLAFDGDRSRFSMRDNMLSELALLMTGEPMPYATLMYVWCPARETGSVITSARTDRIRKLVVESGTTRLNQWLEYERDVRADYLRVFGEEPGRLMHVAIMTDSDNTGSDVRAWYGPLHFSGPLNRVGVLGERTR